MNALTALAAEPAEADRVPVGAKVPSRAATLGGVVLCAAPASILSVWLAGRAADRPMTMDESFTVLTVTRSWWSLVRGCMSDPGMSVYYVLLKLWGLVVGTSLAELRAFSVVAFVAACLGAAWLGVRRSRPLPVAAALVAAVLSPIAREALSDARAATLGIAGAVWLLVAFDDVVNGVAHPRRLRIGIAGSLLLAFTHPSTLFLGAAGIVFAWRAARRAGLGTERRLALVAGALAIVGTASAAIKSGVTTVAKPGLQGMGEVLGQLPGGRVVAGLALLLSALVLLAGLCFDTEPVIRWFGGAGLAWFGLNLAVLPVRNLWVPRYFAAAMVLVVIAVAFARIERWAAPMAALILAVTLLGGIERLDTAYGYGSTWCDVADTLARRIEPGDRLTFAVSSYQSPTIACLGPEARPVLERGVTVPALSGDRYEDPRGLWFGQRPTEADLLHLEPGHASRLVWIEAADPEVSEAVEQLRLNGAHCERERFGGVDLATCTQP